jgi:hypothetical protein
MLAAFSKIGHETFRDPPLAEMRHHERRNASSKSIYFGRRL